MKDRALTRDSNMELLRITVMFLILLLHANYFTFGSPKDHSINSLLRCAAQSFCSVAVPTFVLITGWFGTTFKKEKIFKLIYQVLFAVIIITLAILAFKGRGNEGLGATAAKFAFWKYWFINAYLGLLVIVPFLNMGVEKFSKKQMLIFLGVFYVIFAVPDFLFGAPGFGVIGGNSAIWFVFLYMLGRYLRLYPLNLKTGVLILIFLAGLAGETALLFFHIRGADIDSPFIVMECVSLLLLFSKLSFKSKAVNWIAASSTMVYLTNLHPVLVDYFTGGLKKLEAENTTPKWLVFCFVFCIVWFVASILFDKLRILTYRIFKPKRAE